MHREKQHGGRKVATLLQKQASAHGRNPLAMSLFVNYGWKFWVCIWNPKFEIGSKRLKITKTNQLHSRSPILTREVEMSPRPNVCVVSLKPYCN